MFQAKETSSAKTPVVVGQDGRVSCLQGIKSTSRLSLGQVGLDRCLPCCAGPTATVKSLIFDLRVTGNH